MKPNRVFLLVAVASIALGSPLISSATIAADAGRTSTTARHFDIVNATFDSVTAVAMAPAGRKDFVSRDLDQPLQGGLTAMTLDVPAGGCLRDLRVTFRGGRSQLFRHIDVCRSSGVRLTSRGGR
jgi:hypothetical protein